MSSCALDARTAPISGVETARSPESWDVVIEPARGWAALRLGRLLEYRDLLYFLAWRDIKVRYKQTVLGAAWAILQPLMTMLVFAVVFGHFAKIPSEGSPYALFTYTALVPWTLFAYVVIQSGNSLVEDAKLITKVYFPRLVIPVAAGLAGLADFGIAFVVLLGMMLFFGVTPTAAIFSLPLFVLLALTAALGVGIWLAALNVQYRDVRYTIPFLTQIWLYATPIAYPASLVHGKLHLVFALNPMAGVVEGFRWATLGRGQVDVAYLAVSAGFAAVTFVSGLVYFRRMEQQFADVV